MATETEFIHIGGLHPILPNHKYSFLTEAGRTLAPYLNKPGWIDGRHIAISGRNKGMIALFGKIEKFQIRVNQLCSLGSSGGFPKMEIVPISLAILGDICSLFMMMSTKKLQYLP
ncbi:hypothetical protein F5887DRAFT_925580 [Amanita rubescens]|nr:hypothetical protein F5887DRAFT_925580 [Amanita rubescens]